MQELLSLLDSFNLQNFLSVSGHLLRENPLQFLWFIFSQGGWVFFVIPIPFIARFAWREHRKAKWHHQFKYNLLAIEIPKENEQSIRAVEHIFYQFGATREAPNLKEKWIDGAFVLPLSLEIVSINGFVQFIIRTPERYRDHVEAALYAQYPNAIITEVEDYAEKLPKHWPNEKYEMFGTELVQANKAAFPIRTYPQFEHQLSQTYSDPMAAILEAMSKLKAGEQTWIQMVITPLPHSWQHEFQGIVKKLIGAKAEQHSGFLRNELGALTGEVFGQLAGSTGGEEHAGGAEAPPTLMLHLSPGERAAVEAVQIKLSKPAFATKMRVIYIAEKDKYNRSRGILSVFGGLNQFSALDMNAFQLGKYMTTYVDYFFRNTRMNRRKRLLMHHYKERSQEEGQGEGMILNTEELASIFHFPITTVEAPGVKHTDAKRVGPPLEIPEEVVGNMLDMGEEYSPLVEEDQKTMGGSPPPPDNLPI